MKLDFAVLAEDATAADSRLFIHGGGLQTIVAPRVPWFTHLAVALRFSAPMEELGNEHEVNVTFTAPSGEPRVELPPLPVRLRIENPNIAIEELTVLAAVGLTAVQLPEFGWYTVDLGLDGEPLQRLRFKVVQDKSSTSLFAVDEAIVEPGVAD